ncbi:hypothetical protein GQ473_04695 [archaeon]|nr:hypothetical protein [archaeon]
MTLSFNKVTKIITVLIPDTEITIQNLLNDIRQYEDELSSMDIPIIASCAGKESLGGGVSVGLTLTLLDDWIVAFEARSGPDYIQCKVSGGNIVSYDGSTPISPTAFTQVLITASASATTQELDAIQYASFNGGVTIDSINGVSGTTYNIGTMENPVNNLHDAIIIANSRGFYTLYVSEDIILGSDNDIQNLTVIGRSIRDTNITIDPSVICDNLGVENCYLRGTLDGGIRIETCTIGDMYYVSGYILNSFLDGTVVLNGNEDALFANCSMSNPNNIPIIDMGGSGQNVTFTDYSGCIRFKNMTANNKINIQIDGGCIFLEDTIIAGTITITGIGQLFDESSGTTIITEGFVSRDTISAAIWNAPTADYNIPDTFGANLNTIFIDTIVEGTLTVKKMLRVMFSVLAGTSSGGGTNTVEFDDVTGIKPRVTAVVDVDGNRNSITVDGDD